MTDLTRNGNFAEKKTLSTSAFIVDAADVDSAGPHTLAVLPPNCLVTRRIIEPLVAGQTGLTVDYGLDGGTEFGNDVDIDDVGAHSAESSTPPNTGTGAELTIQFSAAPTEGKFLFVIEYFEYGLSNGKLTDYKPEA